MTPRERLLAAYRCEEVDRIPIVIWVNPYNTFHWMSREPSYTPLLELARATDVLGGWPPGVNIHTVLDGLTIDGHDFRKEHIAARDGHYGKISRYPIESESDLELLLDKDQIREKTRSLLQEAQATNVRGFTLSLTATPVANTLDKKLLGNFQAFIGEYHNFYGT
jgi:hypothetical protein